MKSFVVALCVFAVAAATGLDKDSQVLRSDYVINPDGTYNYVYENDNGIIGQAAATLKRVGEEAALEVIGSNSFKSADGQTYKVEYIANENGYQPQGEHLPTPPPPQPLPDYIQRSLDYIKAHPYVEKKL